MDTIKKIGWIIRKYWRDINDKRIYKSSSSNLEILNIVDIIRWVLLQRLDGQLENIGEVLMM